MRFKQNIVWKFPLSKVLLFRICRVEATSVFHKCRQRESFAKKETNQTNKQPNQKLSTHFSKSNNFVDGRFFTTIIIFAASIWKSEKKGAFSLRWMSFAENYKKVNFDLFFAFVATLLWLSWNKNNTQQMCLSPAKRVLCIINNCASTTTIVHHQQQLCVRHFSFLVIVILSLY